MPRSSRYLRPGTPTKGVVLQPRDRAVLRHVFRHRYLTSDHVRALAFPDLVKGLAERAGVSRSVSPHLLRHSGATELSALGVPLRVIQDILGHESVLTTERYVHPRPGDAILIRLAEIRIDVV